MEMRLSKVLSIIAIVALLFTGVALVARMLGGIAATKATATELQNNQPPAAVVRVSPVTVGPAQAAISYSGSVNAQDTVNVIPKVSGRLLQLNVDIGDRVKKGDVIARLDSDQPTAQLMQAYASLYSAQAKLAQMQEGPRAEQVGQAAASLANAKAKLDSLVRPLDQNEIDIAKAQEVSARAALQQAQSAYDKIAWFDGKGALPQSLALQQATTAYESARATYQEKLAGAKDPDIRAQQALIDSAQASLALAKTPFRDTDFQLARAAVLQSQAVVYGAQLQLKETTIYAPLDGQISAAPLAVGAIATTNAPIVSMVSAAVEVTVKVEEARIGQIKVGQPVTLTVAAYPGETFAAKVTRISPTADPADRSFQIQVVPDIQDGRLKGGMFAEAGIITEQLANALLVPRAAVLSESGRSYVMVAAGGQAERREVELGLSQGDQIQIRAGVVFGEQVVTAGQKGLQSGDWVKAVAVES
jgi:HlyD family secretion protein